MWARAKSSLLFIDLYFRYIIFKMFEKKYGERKERKKRRKNGKREGGWWGGGRKM